MSYILAGIDESDDATLDFDVIPYRGAPVFSTDGWAADVKSRGGVLTQVPGGFFVNVRAARFGSARPYVYELPPLWLLVSDGIDLADAELLDWLDYQGVSEAADNQVQDVQNMVKAAARAAAGVGKGVGDVAANLPSILKWGAIGVAAIAGVELLRTIAPHRAA